MAWTNWGFDGTINEAQWSQMAGLLGNSYVAADSASCVVTAVPGARSVSVAAGTLYGDGVVSVNSGAQTVAMTTPVNGQWYVIALRRTWATNTADLVAIAGATTSTTTPTTAPTSFPTLNTSAGVLTDQPIAWAWCNSANTTVVIFDLRLLPMRSQPVSVADAAKRDAKFPAPSQGNQVWRDDLGSVETYYDLVSVGNPGGRDVAGWYTDTRQVGLVPIRPASVVIATGSGEANSLGVVTFTGATSIQLNGVFTSAYTNYRIIVNFRNSSASSGTLFRLCSAGTPNTTTNYASLKYGIYGNGTSGNSIATGQTFLDLGGVSGAINAGFSTLDISEATTVFRKRVNLTTTGYSPSSGVEATWVGGGTINLTSAFDGLYLGFAAGNHTGTIQVFGYND